MSIAIITIKSVYDFHVFSFQFPMVPVAQTASVLTSRASAVLNVCAKIAKLRFAGVDLKDASYLYLCSFLCVGEIWRMQGS